MIESKVAGLEVDKLQQRALDKFAKMPGRRRQLQNPTIKMSPRDYTLVKPANTIPELLSHEEEEFVRVVFLFLLGRQPESSALNHYVGLLNQGVDKAHIIARISLSGEARARAPDLPGMLRLRMRFLFSRVPVLGYVGDWLWRILSLPKYLQYLRAREAQMYRLHREHNEQLKAAAGDFHRLSEALEALRDNTEIKLDSQDFDNAYQSLVERLLTKAENTQLEELQNSFSAELGSKASNSELETKVAQLQRELNRVARTTGDSHQSRQAPTSSEHQAKTNKVSGYDSFYVAFEDRFRGSEASVKASFVDYDEHLTELPAQARCLDIGCGRGEWLQLLAERGFTAEGIDINSTMVSECVEKGLAVSEADLTNYLSGIDADTFDLISAFHVVEHLEFDDLLFLFDESLRILKPGGKVIFETPNPSNMLVGSRNFYLDPTHRNPLPEEMLRFVAEHRGYSSVEILGLHPAKQLNLEEMSSDLEKDVLQRFYGPQDYAVIAVK